MFSSWPFSVELERFLVALLLLDRPKELCSSCCPLSDEAGGCRPRRGCCCHIEKSGFWGKSAVPPACRCDATGPGTRLRAQPEPCSSRSRALAPRAQLLLDQCHGQGQVHTVTP